jgi:hypothetical protein
MLDSTILDTYNRLKNKMEAAYFVFKKEPTVTNAAAHTTALQTYTNFCVETMKTLAGDVGGSVDNTEKVLKDFDAYRTCKQCDSEILYKVDKHILESSDFVPDFPGWCYTCLVKHCMATDCEACTLVKDFATCSFKETKAIYNNSQEY